MEFDAKAIWYKWDTGYQPGTHSASKFYNSFIYNSY